MSPKKKTYQKKQSDPSRRPVTIRSKEAEASDWDAFYRRGKLPWRSSGVGRVARLFLTKALQSGRLLEVGCGTGDDANEIIERGFEYNGIDFSHSAIAQAQRRLSGTKVSFVCSDFFSWKAKERYAVVYEKGVFHGLGGLRRRQLFARRVATVLNEQGIWITVSGSADKYNPQFPHGAVFLTHLVEAIEPYFEILQIVKGLYGTRNPVQDFEAWHGVFRRRG
jgi:SAM-dependent methyltransferase